MKSIKKIAEEQNVTYYHIAEIIRKEKIIPAYTAKRKKYYDEHQEKYILEILKITYHIVEVCYMIYESKMNIKESFEDFKKRVYN